MQDEEAVMARQPTPASWLLEQGHRHVLMEIANECDNARTITTSCSRRGSRN